MICNSYAERVVVGRGTAKRYPGPGTLFIRTCTHLFVIIQKGTPNIQKNTRGKIVKIKKVDSDVISKADYSFKPKLLWCKNHPDTF